MSRTLTDSTGNVKDESDYYPGVYPERSRRGGERVISAVVTDSFRFTGLEWDSEDTLNHTLFRQYTPFQGRWETPDPVRGCVNFPQGQNRYAYVKDNATNLTDPRGDQCSQVRRGFISSPEEFCGCCNEDPIFVYQNSEACCDACGACAGGAAGLYFSSRPVMSDKERLASDRQECFPVTCHST